MAGSTNGDNGDSSDFFKQDKQTVQGTFKKDIKGSKKLGTSKPLQESFDMADAQRLKRRAKHLIATGKHDKAKEILSKGLKIMKSVGKKGLHAIPLVGGLAAALAQRDASAAIPILGDVEAVGPEPGSLTHKLESGTITPEERKLFIQERLRNKRFRN